MDFVALDFETANSRRNSACEIGLAKFVNGQVVDELSSLIFQEQFDQFNESLHGINRKMVQGAPILSDFWPTVEKFIADLPVVAHNASFDISVLQNSLQPQSPTIEFDYFCTLLFSRKSLDLSYFGLPSVAEHLGIDYPMDHRALNDARAAGQVMSKLLELNNETSLLSLAKTLAVPQGRYLVSGPTGLHSSEKRQRLTAEQRTEILKNIPESDLYEDPDFAGKHIVFTGALSSMSRDEAHKKVYMAGGIPEDNVTKKTNILVFGYQDPRALKGKPISAKRAKVEELKNKGQEIETVDEALFLEMLANPHE